MLPVSVYKGCMNKVTRSKYYFIKINVIIKSVQQIVNTKKVLKKIKTVIQSIVCYSSVDQKRSEAESSCVFMKSDESIDHPQHSGTIFH